MERLTQRYEGKKSSFGIGSVEGPTREFGIQHRSPRYEVAAVIIGGAMLAGGMLASFLGSREPKGGNAGGGGMSTFFCLAGLLAVAVAPAVIAMGVGLTGAALALPLLGGVALAAITGFLVLVSD